MAGREIKGMLGMMRPEQAAMFRQLPPEKKIEIYNQLYGSV